MYYIYYIPAFDGSMYVGQTKNLQKRQSDHRTDLHRCNDPKYLYFRKLGMNKKDIKLYVLKYCDKENVNELERKFIKIFGKLNKVRYDFNEKEYQKEYQQKNKEKIKEYQKEWREKNKEKQKENQKEYYKKKVMCDVCGKEMNRSSLKRHKKRKH